MALIGGSGRVASGQKYNFILCSTQIQSEIFNVMSDKINYNIENCSYILQKKKIYIDKT